VRNLASLKLGISGNEGANPSVSTEYVLKIIKTLFKSFKQGFLFG